VTHKANPGKKPARRQTDLDQSAKMPRIFRERSNYVISTGGSSVVRGLSQRRGGMKADDLINIITSRPTKA
jgi:hypothetical protein